MSAVGPGELRRGWRNLCAATLGIGLGIASYTPVSSLFFQALESEYGWSKAAAAGALIALPVTALVLPAAGWLIDRYGVRIVAGVSAALTVLSYLWLSRMTGNLREFYLALVTLNVLGCATGPVAYTRLIAAQFTVQRGMALAMAQFGIAFIAVLMPQFIGAMISGYGWRGGYLFFAAATAVGALGAQALMRPAAAGERDVGAAGMAPGAAASTAGFWLLGMAVLAISAAAFGLIAQFQSVLADRHIGLPQATLLLSLFAVAVMVSRLVVGRLLDTAHPERAAAGVMAVSASGIVLLLFGPKAVAATALAVMLVGSSIGAELDLLSFFCARLFGVRRYAAIYGLLSAFFYVGIAVGGIGYGVIKTRSGSYDAALAGSALLFAVAALLFLLLGRQAAFRGPIPDEAAEPHFEFSPA